MAGPHGDEATVPSRSPSDSDSDLTDLSVVSTDYGECRDERHGLLLNCDHIVTSIISSCSRGTLAALMGVNRQLYGVIAPMLYEIVRLDDVSINSFFNGCTTLTGAPRGREGDRRKSKAELLASTRVLTLGAHNGTLCSLNAPGAACMTGLETLRIVMPISDTGSPRLCSHSQCELLKVLEPNKVVIRDCNARTKLPLDLRWSLPNTVQTVVLFLPVFANQYYEQDGDALTHLTRSVVGNFRLVPNIKIVFWEHYEAATQSRDLMTHYRRSRIVIDDIVPLIQNAVCTNHRPLPTVTVYGLETVDLKGGGNSALARMYPGFTHVHELVHHALQIAHHTLVPSPWTGQKVPYRIPAVNWEDIEVYELDEDRGAEVNDDD